jgi:long-subunit acyl-CoA synthetase (AMP-forming)
MSLFYTILGTKSLTQKTRVFVSGSASLNKPLAVFFHRTGNAPTCNQAGITKPCSPAFSWLPAGSIHSVNFKLSYHLPT